MYITWIMHTVCAFMQLDIYVAKCLGFIEF